MKSQNSPNLYLSVLHTEIYSSCIPKSTHPAYQNIYLSCISKSPLVLVIKISTRPAYLLSTSLLVLYIKISTCPAHQNLDLFCITKYLLVLHINISTGPVNQNLYSESIEKLKVASAILLSILQL